MLLLVPSIYGLHIAGYKAAAGRELSLCSSALLAYPGRLVWLLPRSHCLPTKTGPITTTSVYLAMQAQRRVGDGDGLASLALVIDDATAHSSRSPGHCLGQCVQSRVPLEQLRNAGGAQQPALESHMHFPQQVLVQQVCVVQGTAGAPLCLNATGTMVAPMANPCWGPAPPPTPRKGSNDGASLPD